MHDHSMIAHYGTGYERDRLKAETSRIEFARTKELLGRHLPPPPASALDVGGGPGVYASWLANAGYRMHLVDPVPLHVEQATEASAGIASFTASLGDARHLEESDHSYDIVLLLGPLYHITDRDERVAALAEARRVVRPDGVVVAAAISRFASLLDGLLHGYLSDPTFHSIVNETSPTDSIATRATGWSGSRRRIFTGRTSSPRRSRSDLAPAKGLGVPRDTAVHSAFHRGVRNGGDGARSGDSGSKTRSPRPSDSAFVLDRIPSSGAREPSSRR